MPNRSCRYSSIDKPTICMMVLYLAKIVTFMRLRAPISAIHSRSADTAISRPMMTTATMTTNQRGRDDELVRDGIQESAEARGLAQLTRVITVKAVGDACERERRAGRGI